MVCPYSILPKKYVLVKINMKEPNVVSINTDSEPFFYVLSNGSECKSVSGAVDRRGKLYEFADCSKGEIIWFDPDKKPWLFNKSKNLWTVQYSQGARGKLKIIGVAKVYF